MTDTTVAALTKGEIAAMRKRYRLASTVGDARVIRALDALDAAQRRVEELEAALREIDAIDDGLANAEHAAALMALTAREALAAPHDAEGGGGQ